MGSQFFNPIKMAGTILKNPLNPMAGPMSLAGPNSWLAKQEAYDDPTGGAVSKIIAPQAYANGQAYANRHNPADGNWGAPGAYQGQAPTLSAANQGYVLAARNAASGNQVNPYGN